MWHADAAPGAAVVVVVVIVYCLLPSAVDVTLGELSTLRTSTEHNTTQNREAAFSQFLVGCVCMCVCMCNNKFEIYSTSIVVAREAHHLL